MKLNYYLLFISIFGLTIINGQPQVYVQKDENFFRAQRLARANQQAQQESNTLNCQCYCSDLCGPRQANKPGDAPFVDPETGICFCQQRDKDNYIPHGCNLKPKTNFKSCCE